MEKQLTFLFDVVYQDRSILYKLTFEVLYVIEVCYYVFGRIFWIIKIELFFMGIDIENDGFSLKNFPKLKNYFQSIGTIRPMIT